MTTQLGLQICENQFKGPELGPWDPIRGLLIGFVVLEGPLLMDGIWFDESGIRLRRHKVTTQLGLQICENRPKGPELGP